MIAKTLMISAVALVTQMESCRMTTRGVTATEQALCDVWQDSLPSRSRSDTAQTIEEIGRAYDKFEAACQREVKI